MNTDDFLGHHGVKGMKWGVRKDRKVGGDYDALAVPAAYAAMLLGMYGTKKVISYLDSGKIRENKARSKAFVTRSPVANWKTDPKLASKSLSPDQIHKNVVKQINPDFPASGTKMNCRRATLSYELRRRVYDVKATKSRFATGQDQAGLTNAISPGKHQYRNDLTANLFHKNFRE